MVGGSSGSLNVGDGRELANGLMRLLEHAGCLRKGLADPGTCLVDTTSQGVSYHYSSMGGFWVPEKKVGDRVAPGHVLGSLIEAIGGRQLEQVRADRAGVVVTVRRYPVVHARELLVRVAEDAR